MLSYPNSEVCSFFMEETSRILNLFYYEYPDDKESLLAVEIMFGVMNGSLPYWLDGTAIYDWDYIRAEVQNGPDNKESEEERKRREEEEKERELEELRKKVKEFVFMDSAGATIGSLFGPVGQLTGAVLLSGYEALTWE